ncbi:MULTISPECIES: nucleoside triphosphate pyrophosphohydrolase [unclassified Microcystis]|jgi:XTP/dITP diphosphohydrolase|uniref:nucleoside triphosphate pyrophosphohydrolase n=1 Tax=unclassified Microcystis TaxID=2643300 RepID=UPI0022CA3E37|nr:MULTISPECIES: nucleoside triphosphate pyrophosphohydrolase [unclassified Microcystis]MCA2690816.1 nucleoside triphosphate pyrophosphohydrolase [Microcystis sp. M034S2]MCA2750282.1 nucleoside triphosphate pyrophosphohydrolase [Microcystis sp. M144S2]MCZ8198849.1 nucleoside triphosphate pyrophosphohydrolase [Microcystis sp. LE19-55.1A]MCZ8307829.1 nucleoside triphosphate pyrophosphohydrolase [Microcystis sp. LE19-98.1E]
MSSLPETDNPSYKAILAALNHLISVVARLRDPESGCPWDLAQTPETLIPYVIEEAYEVVAAIKSGDKTAIAEELGDLLLQVVLQAQIASDEGNFSLEEVARGITDKLIRRHPHVFGQLSLENPEQVRQNWEKIKAEEKNDPTISGKLTRYAQTLPPLIGAMKISRQAARVGFEWENIAGVWEKFGEELAEWQESLESGDKEHQQAELGDLLFTIVNLARWYDLDPSIALQETNLRFIQRFSLVESVAEKPLHDYTLEELTVFWQQAKAKLHQPSSGQ